MSIVMSMQWKGITPEQYDATREKVGWETDPAAGGSYHIAWFADGALHVTDVWDSAEAFENFVEARLMPVAKGELGLPGEPEVQVSPLHRVWDARHAEALT